MHGLPRIGTQTEGVESARVLDSGMHLTLCVASRARLARIGQPMRSGQGVAGPWDRLPGDAYASPATAAATTVATAAAAAATAAAAAAAAAGGAGRGRGRIAFRYGPLPDAFGGEPAAAGLSVSLVDDDPASIQVQLGGVPVLALVRVRVP